MYKSGLTVLGGGRYDGLVQEFGGAPTPAVGFATGVERLMEMFYEYNENTHELIGQGYSDEMHIIAFRVGDEVTVKLTNVNVEAREITFEL